ncbi:MAG: hypothetical protein NVS9B10_26890 [Nevskia sp.]
MFKKNFAFAGAALAAAVVSGCIETPVAPTASGAAPSDARQTAQADSTTEIKYCQTDDATGSHLQKHTVCLTEQQEREQRQALEASRSFRQTGQGGGH